jgi:hypothetical protein
MDGVTSASLAVPQRELLTDVRAFTARHGGRAPTVDEIRKLRFAISPGPIERSAVALAARGYLALEGEGKRTRLVPLPAPPPPPGRVDLVAALGMVAARLRPILEAEEEAGPVAYAAYFGRGEVELLRSLAGEGEGVT